MKRLLIFVLLLIFSTLPDMYGQSPKSVLEKYTNKDVQRYKIDHHQYDLWWNENNSEKYRGFSFNQSILPQFVAIADYKGIINYGVEFSSRDGRNFSFIENYYVSHLKVNFAQIRYNPTDSIAEIEGTVTDGASGFNLGNAAEALNIFVGTKKDSVCEVVFYPFTHPESPLTHYKGKPITAPLVLDTLPSFVIEDYALFKSSVGKERPFKFRTKISKNSILVVGNSYHFAEIFDIGKMISQQQPREDSRAAAYRDEPTRIIINNVQASDKEAFLKPQKLAYYKTTEKAEDYIISGQFANAKRMYDSLRQQNSYLFARDLHNAVRCNILARDYKTAIYFCEQLVLKGVPLRYFDASIFRNLKRNLLWQSFVTDYPALAARHQEQLNKNLISGLAELVSMDQIDYQKNAKGQIAKSELQKTTDTVSRRFIELIAKEGFPTEERIGVKLVRDTIISTSPDYYVLIYHNHQIANSQVAALDQILASSATKMEYDAPRSNLDQFVNVHQCLQVYRGKLYASKTCHLKGNEPEIKKVKFRFKNKNGFIMEGGKFVTIVQDIADPQISDAEFMSDFTFITKLTDDVDFYEN